MKKRSIKRILIRLALVLAVLSAPYVYSRLASPWRAVSMRSVEIGPVEGSDTGALRVGAYNIAHGRGNVLGESNWGGGDDDERRQRLEQIGVQIRSLDLDVVVLNEADFASVWSGHVDQADMVARSAGLQNLAEQRNLDVAFPFVRVVFGNAVLSRFPIASAELVRFAPMSQWENLTAGNHNAILARIDTPTFGQINVLGVHLEVRSEEVRLRAAERILKIADLANGPLIVLGDFNSTPTAFPGSSPVGELGTAIDVLMGSGRFESFPDASVDEGHYTFPSSNPTRTIDWILVSGGLSIHDAGVAQSNLSDHLPVWAEIEPRGAADTGLAKEMSGEVE